MNTTFIINGGAGRVITAIPALEKYARLNPDDDFKILAYGWELLYWSHPLLQDKAFSAGQKGVFDFIIKNNRVICPEPYIRYGYYNQHLSLAEAFDEEINQTNEHSDLEKPNLYISTYEQSSIRRIISEFKQEMKKSKVVVIQPYGSGMSIINGRPYDSTHRSIDVDQYLKLIKLINKDCLIFYFGSPEFRHPMDDVTPDLSKFNPDLRMYMSLISECDYFIGCDSVGQHMAKAFNKPGAIFMGSTFEKNVSYDCFRSFRKKDRNPKYNPIRIPGIDAEFVDRLNDGIMDLSDEEIENFVKIINEDIYGK